MYHPGRDNIESHILSRVMYAPTTKKSLYKLKQSLFHEWATRQSHFVKTNNLPYSIDKHNDKPPRCECKAKYHSSAIFPFFKATEQFERIKVDLKGQVLADGGFKTSIQFYLSKSWRFKNNCYQVPYFTFVASGNASLCILMSIVITGPPLWVKSYASF